MQQNKHDLLRLMQRHLYIIRQSLEWADEPHAKAYGTDVVLKETAAIFTQTIVNIIVRYQILNAGFEYDDCRLISDEVKYAETLGVAIQLPDEVTQSIDLLDSWETCDSVPEDSFDKVNVLVSIIEKYVQELESIYLTTSENSLDVPRAVELSLERFVKEVQALLKEQLVAIILYGSYARGDYHEFSDVDVMVLVKALGDDRRLIEQSVSDIAYDAGYEHELMIMPIVRELQMYQRWKNVHPFYREVKQDGIILYGENQL